MKDLSKQGLKARRAKTAKEPEHKCDNCGHLRYSPCYCPVKGKK